jgi:hypothetical protein
LEIKIALHLKKKIYCDLVSFIKFERKLKNEVRKIGPLLIILKAFIIFFVSKIT